MKFLLLVFLCLSTILNAKICDRWGKHKVIGYLDHSFVDEASGIIVSKYKNRLYHTNDSGDGPFLFQTTLFGKKTKKIKIENFKPRDVESLAYGKCPAGNCLIIADVGDNIRIRKDVSFVVIKEMKKFSKSVKPLAIIKATYPNGPHNVEGVALHPNGDLFILTKSPIFFGLWPRPAKIFVLRKKQWMSGKKNIQPLEYLGKLHIPYFLSGVKPSGKIVTGFDISPSGKNLLINTYKTVFEIDLDLSNPKRINLKKFRRGVDLSIEKLRPLKQIESISYLNENSFIYSTEYHSEQGPSPIVRVDCLKRASDFFK